MTVQEKNTVASWRHRPVVSRIGCDCDDGDDNDRDVVIDVDDDDDDDYGDNGDDEDDEDDHTNRNAEPPLQSNAMQIFVSVAAASSDLYDFCLVMLLQISPKQQWQNSNINTHN